MELLQLFVIGTFLTLFAKSTIADYPKSEELTLRNQLLADVYFLKEGVEKLHISSQILSKRFTNQMEVLQTLQNKINDNFGIDENEEQNCNKITGMFNITLKKQNMLESRIIVKLEEIQEDQLTRFEEMLLKQRLNKNCGTQPVSSNTLTLLSNTLSEISEQIEHFELKLINFGLLEEKLNAQQTKFDKFAEMQLKILQGIDEKLAKNQDQFNKFGQELTELKALNLDLKKNITRPYPKLPMEVILGLTSANLTTF